MKWPKLKKNDTVEVQWHDIVGTSGWLDESTAAISPCILCWSVGYFLNRTKGILRISSSMNNNNGSCCC
jgi:hypothetical protein